MKRLAHDIPVRGRGLAFLSAILMVVGLGFLPPVFAQADKEATTTQDMSGEEAHRAILQKDRFPSAVTCKTCHENHYREWSVSPHAYALLSPVFNAFQATFNVYTNGTVGDFCVRCHTVPGMLSGEPIYKSAMDRPAVTREGVTCIVCHRISEVYAKESGRMKLVEGELLDPIYGPRGNEELKRVIASHDYQVVTERDLPGRQIHRDAKKLFVIENPGFCGMCHDVNFPIGFRLEEAFSQFKTSPAAAKGISCQDCHMATEPGIPSDYAIAPAATIGGVDTKPKKRTNHMFPGPDHSIIHPGLYPHNPDAADLATMKEWLTFDYKAGWGTDDFEDNVADDHPFPGRWSSADDRYDAREIINRQLDLLKEYFAVRKKLLQVGYVLGDVVTEQSSAEGIKFKVQLQNGTDGHGVPTGFDAERISWLQVTVTDRDGAVIFRSGDLDPNGDVRDLHSLYVHNGELPLDEYLFSYQSRFVTRNLRGSEREQIIGINYSFTPLPFFRPLTQSKLLLGRPVVNRKDRRNIEPLGERWPTYKVEGTALTGKGPYTADIKLIAGMVPVNLIDILKDVGYDYGLTPREVADRVVAGHVVLWEKQVKFEVP